MHVLKCPFVRNTLYIHIFSMLLFVSKHCFEFPSTINKLRPFDVFIISSNPEVHPILFHWKKKLKNVTIYLDRFGNKNNPYGVMLILSQFFFLLFNIAYCRVTDLEF